MVKNYTLLLSCILLFSFLLSCAPKSMPDTSAPQKQTASSDSIQRPDSAAFARADEFQKIIEKARKEGRVVIFSGNSIRPVGEAFSNKYGIEAEIMVGRGGEFGAKLFAERRAGLYRWDIALVGSTTSVNILRAGEVLEPLEPALILPEIMDPKTWRGGEPSWIDKDRQILSYIRFVNIPIYINTSIVRPDEIKSFNDLLNPKWKGKIAMNDPTVTGTGSKWVAVIGSKIMGWDFIRQLAAQEPVFITDQYLHTQWLALGKYPIGLGVKPELVTEFVQTGSPIAGITPVEGSYTTIGGGSVAIIKNAPHPNASILFTNWLLTREGQMVYSKSYDRPSNRADVPTEGFPPESVPQPGVKYVNSDTEDILQGEMENMRRSREIFGQKR